MSTSFSNKMSPFRMAVGSIPCRNFISGAWSGFAGLLIKTYEPTISANSSLSEHEISRTPQLRRAAACKTIEVLPEPVGPEMNRASLLGLHRNETKVLNESFRNS